MKNLQLLLFSISALIFPACEKQSQEQAVEDLEKTMSKLQEEELKKLEDGGMATNDPVDTTRISDAIDKVGDVSSGQEKIAMELLKLFMQRAAAEAGKLIAAKEDLNAGQDYSKVKEMADLDVLSEKVRNYRRVNAEVKVKMGMPLIEELKKEADKVGLKGRVRADFFAGMEDKLKLQLPVLNEMRDLDDQMCAAILVQHDVLRKHFGEWEIKDGAMQISSDEAMEACNAFNLEVQAITGKQMDAQRRILSIQ